MDSYIHMILIWVTYTDGTEYIYLFSQIHKGGLISVIATSISTDDNDKKIESFLFY